MYRNLRNYSLLFSPNTRIDYWLFAMMNVKGPRTWFRADSCQFKNNYLQWIISNHPAPFSGFLVENVIQGVCFVVRYIYFFSHCSRINRNECLTNVGERCGWRGAMGAALSSKNCTKRSFLWSNNFREIFMKLFGYLS